MVVVECFWELEDGQKIAWQAKYVFDIDGEYVDENTVAVNIRRLREKIKDNSTKPEYLKNVRGLGYVWDKEVR